MVDSTEYRRFIDTFPPRTRRRIMKSCAYRVLAGPQARKSESSETITWAASSLYQVLRGCPKASAAPARALCGPAGSYWIQRAIGNRFSRSSTCDAKLGDTTVLLRNR